ncbi:MAG: hypothetical protein LUF84_00895, partial [Clostridiales bacterium]|nr:hypothetical protein [Clostridiales bacterium]
MLLSTLCQRLPDSAMAKCAKTPTTFCRENVKIVKNELTFLLGGVTITLTGKVGTSRYYAGRQIAPKNESEVLHNEKDSCPD